MKPQNILLTSNGEAKIADFGLSGAIHQPLRTYTAEIMTPFYKPPELYFGETHYASNVDMWSIGCIFAELLRGVPIFSGICELDILLDIFCKLGTPTDKHTSKIYKELMPPFWKNFPKFTQPRINEILKQLGERVDKDCKDLLLKMLDMHPTKRICARDALKHPFFADLPGNLLLTKNTIDKHKDHYYLDPAN